ncbi:MAG TPA: Rieske 2Fe-2S domain-containing protein [Actinomycetota bacterium]
MDEGAAGDADGWTTVVAAGSLADGKPIRVRLGKTDVMVYRTGGRLFAISDRCTHQGAPLHLGRVRSFGSIVVATCPAHGSQFRLDDGGVMRGPATAPVASFDARIEGEDVQLRPRPA